MAVRHGYGKVAGADALTFAYDTGDIRNSYKGEPTTNLIPSGVAFCHSTGQGAAATVEDAPEKGPGWKKVTITARGTNFRIIQWTYLSMTANTLYCHSIVFDWGNMRGKNYFIYFDGDGTGTRAYYRPGDYVNTGGTNIDSSMPDGKFAGTITHTGNHAHAFFIGNYTLNQSGLNDYFYYKEYQAEVNSHPTQYTGGTRSATQALLDLTGNSEITLNSVSFDSNAQMLFDGTDDSIGYAYVGISNYSQPFTMECVFIVDPAATWDNGYRSNIFGIAGSYAGMYGLNKHSGDSVGLYVRDASGGGAADVGGLSKGVYYHLVGTWDGTDDIRIYLNGSLRNTATSAKSGAPDTTSIWLGGTRAYSGTSGQVYHGEIPVAKYYNRALTAIEVRNNFNLYKGRFNM